jgi:hypothetical protein
VFGFPIRFRCLCGLLAVSNPALSRAVETLEGHAVRLGEHGEIIGITIVNARCLLERDGGLKVTVP